MGDLLEFQRRFIGTLLGTPVTDFELVGHPAIEIHRRTVFSGLAKALALSFPTIRSLTGPDYFEHLVRELLARGPGAISLDALIASRSGLHSMPK
jgi:Putative DNA-binding domain